MKQNYYLNSISWSILIKILEGVTRFISIPIFITSFGNLGFGLVTLALAINASSQLLNLGVNTGSIKYFSEKNRDNFYFQKLYNINLSFYSIVSLLNILFLLTISVKPEFWFPTIQIEQVEDFRYFMYILIIACVPSWHSQLVGNIYIANNKIVTTHFTSLLRSIGIFLLAFAVYAFDLSLRQYFSITILINILSTLPLYLQKVTNVDILKIKFSFDFHRFKPVLKYSLGIFSIGIFHLILIQSRPLILSIFSSSGTEILTDFRVIEVFPLFVTSLGNIWVSTLLPKSTKFYSEKNQIELQNYVNISTKYISIILAIISFGLILNIDEVLLLYVGKEFSGLSPWLTGWMLTLLIYLHNIPATSLILGSGKIKSLFWMTSSGVVISIILNIILIRFFEIGSVVLSYLFYRFYQFVFYYFHIIPKTLDLNPIKVFARFLVPTLIVLIAFIMILSFNIYIENLMIGVIIRSLIFVALSVTLLLALKQINFKELNQII